MSNPRHADGGIPLTQTRPADISNAVPRDGYAVARQLHAAAFDQSEVPMLYEYAISAGAGTLLDYGVTDLAGLNEKPLAAVEASGHMREIHMEAAPCPEDCETGK